MSLLEQYRLSYKLLTILIQNNRGESEEANILRCLMDTLWNDLTEQEQSLFRN